MAKVFIEETSLTAIGDAIRAKTGDSALMSPAAMATAIEGITTGGGGGGECNGRHIPDEALTITGNCTYKFANNGMNWFIEQCGDKITTEDITNGSNMFINSNKLTSIPFDLNFKSNSSYVPAGGMFSSCFDLEEIGDINNLYPDNMAGMFSLCGRLRYLPNFNNLNLSRMQTYAYANVSSIFSGCHSLRSIPRDFLKQFYGIQTGAGYSVFYTNFTSCFALDEIRGLNPQTGAITSSNMFSSTFKDCYRLKDIIFELQEDGSPYTVNWKSQTINLTSYVGYVQTVQYLTTQYNSGITEDKEVTDDATYQALKNDPDWFTTDIAYSRYNHDSAVNTINSLPITTNTGCTIKFRGAAGELTDGGAINTLTEEEIAVAAAKGWTVTLT